MLARVPYLAFGLLALLAAPRVGFAQAPHNTKIHDLRPEAHLGIGFFGGLGGGGGAEFAIVPEGFLSDLDDELALRVGGELVFDDDDGPGDDDDLFGAALVATQWNLYLSPEWSVFPELGLTLIIGDYGRGNDSVHLDIVFAAGGRYHLGTRTSLFLRIIHPFGFQFGVTF